MTERMTHEEYIAMQRRRVAELARQIVAQEIDVLDGSCKIAELRFQVEVEDCDQDFMPFALVSSETDHLPIGIEALNWSDEALVRKEPELKHVREWAMETVGAGMRKSCCPIRSRIDVGPKELTANLLLLS